jgi:Tol biopolymer transport system component
MRKEMLLLTTITFAISIQTSAVSAYDNRPAVKGPYLEQQPPGMTAVMFAPGIVSTDRSEVNSVFSPNGEEFYFTTWEQQSGTQIMVTRQVEGRWNEPQRASFSTDPSDVDPAISHDGQRVFFSSKQPRPGENMRREDGFDIWFADREGSGWGEAQFLGPVINSGKSQVYPSLTHDGTLYFQTVREEGYGKADIYRSRLIDGVYQPPENLGPVINSDKYEGDAFVAHDESYLIVTIYGREDGLGKGDLYISFRSPDGSWSPLKNMGSAINSAERDFSPMVTPDGKYLFFSSKRAGEGDIFWVDAKVIEVLNNAQERSDAPDDLSGDYLGYPHPGTTPELFAPGLVSTGFSDGCVSFGQEGNLFVFQRYENKVGRIFEMISEDGRWDMPRELPFSQSHRVGDFTIAPDGRTLFFQSNIPVEEIGSDGEDGNVWTATRDIDGWSEPTVLGSAINSKWHDSFPCAAADGTLYFFSRRPGGYGQSDLYVSRWVDGRYEKAENLGPVLNTSAHEWDPFISPDQDYLIFCSTKEGGYGEDDLYITFMQADGTWSLPVNMGTLINSEASENRPWVTSDGKYLFFASTRPGLGRSDVYWVDASIINTYRTQ